MNTESDYPADMAQGSLQSATKLAQHYAANAPNRAGYGAGEAIAPSAPSFFDQVGQRIGALSSILSETNQELSMLGDRVFGGQPQSGANSPKTSPQGAGHAGSVLEAFDMLLTSASDNAQRARALNSRL